MTRAAFLAVAFWAWSAWAQLPPTTGTTGLPIVGVDLTPVANPSINTFSFGASSCNTTLLVQWQANLVDQPCGPLHLWATQGTSCGDAPAATDISYADVDQFSVQTLRTGSVSVDLAQLPGFTTETDGGTPCGASGVEVTHSVCGAISTSYSCFYGGTSSPTHATSLTLTYDTKPPAPPTPGDVSAFDGTVRVAFTAPADAATVGAQLEGPTDTDFLERASVAATQSSIVVKDLRDGVDYRLRLVAYDSAGNQSEPSAPVTVTPLATEGFWGAYRAAGGTDSAGCSSAPGPLVGLLAILLARRRFTG